MATGITKLSGWDRLAKRLKTYGQPELLGFSQQAVADIADAHVADAKARVPVLTGAMRDSISSELAFKLKKFGNKSIFVLYTVTASDPGAPAVEYGTEKMAAQPFMRPSAEYATGLCRQLLGQVVKAGTRGK